MRSLLIASVMLFLGGSSAVATAASSKTEARSSQAAASSVSPAPTVDPLAHILGRPDARSLQMNDLWTEFEIAFANFEQDLASTEEASPETQTGFRNYVNAIESAAAVHDLLGAMLERNELGEDDRLDALDSYLTIEQVSGSLMVEIQQCERGAKALRALASKPETMDRPLLLQGTNQWLAKADRCVERQHLEAQIAARESQADAEEMNRLRQELAGAVKEDERQKLRAEIAEREAQGDVDEEEMHRLRQELADAVKEDADIAREEQLATGDDELVLSRAELLSLLRESAGERRGGGLLADFLEHPRAHLPSHEYGLEFRGGITHVPNFVLGAFYEKHGTAGPEAQYGGSFFARKNERRRDISLNYDYTNLDLGESWWVRKNKSRGSSRWMEIASPKHTVTVGLDRNFLIGKKERFQIHIGGMFGFSILPDSTFPRSRVDAGQCLIGISGETSGHLDLFDEGGACYNAQDPSRSDPLKLPVILPSIGMRLGMRYVIADRIQLGIEGGVHDMYFYTNANIGVIVGRKHKHR